jgi:hypothetical protein
VIRHQQQARSVQDPSPFFIESDNYFRFWLTILSKIMVNFHYVFSVITTLVLHYFTTFNLIQRKEKGIDTHTP